MRLWDEAGLERDPPRPDRGDQLGPAARQVVVHVHDARVGRLAAGLDRVARVGEDQQLVRPDQELAGRSRHLLLAVAEGETRQVARVLGPDAEVGVDTRLGEAGSKPRQPGRTGGPVRLRPGAALPIGRRWGEVSRLGEPTAHM